MSELAASFKTKKTAGQKRRAFNRKRSAKYLDIHKILFTSNNNGAHLIMDGHRGYIDFWPGTGKWKSRIHPCLEGFGVKNLCKEILQQTI